MKFQTAVKFAAAVMALSVHATASAATAPKGTSHDPRIQYIMYNPDDVTLIKTRVGNSTLIQLEKGEYLVNDPTTGLSMGNTEAWTLGVRGNNIFLKPKAEFPDTNINLVTNKRTYSMALVNLDDEENKSKKNDTVSWQVRYMYPAEPVQISAAGNSTQRRENPGPCSDGPKNFNWFKSGDQSLSPTEVWDDGRFTCMRFPTSKALPAPYRYEPETELKEARPNFNWNGDVLVIHEVSEEYRLRLGRKVLALKTDSLQPAAFNSNMTTTGEVRVTLDAN